MECITYKKGYKYQLSTDYSTTIDFKPDKVVGNKYVQLNPDGVLTIKEGYAWDGASGPAIDTHTIMRGSLVHDALYQLMRIGALEFNEKNRDKADRIIRAMCDSDSMIPLRATWVYLALKLFGKPAADPKSRKKDILAPKKCRKAARK